MSGDLSQKKPQPTKCSFDHNCLWGRGLQPPPINFFFDVASVISNLHTDIHTTHGEGRTNLDKILYDDNCVNPPDGRVNLGRLARGDFVNGFRQDFGPMDFAVDALVHSGALLGAGWVASIII